MKHVRWSDVVQAWQGRRLDQAYAYTRQFLRAQPNHADALSLLLQMELARQEWPEVDRICRVIERLWRKKTEDHPMPVAVLLAWARASMAQQKYDQAKTCCLRVLEQDLNCAEASRYLAIIAQQSGCFLEARHWYEHALAQQEDSETIMNLGVLLLQLNEYDSACLLLEKAVVAQPDSVAAWKNLSLARQYLGQESEALQAILRARELDPDDAVAISNHMFLLNFMPCADPLERMGVIRSAGENLERIYREKGGKTYDVWRCSCQPERLRIGLVGGDFCAHPVGYFLRAPLECLRAYPVEIVLYDTCPVSDTWSRALRKSVWCWRDVSGMNDGQLAERIHADGVHVLIDVAGHTAHNRLSVFCAKAAPLQISWLGYFATTGVPGIEYLLADPWIIPPQCNDLLSEKPLYLPATYRCFQVPEDDVVPNDLPMLEHGTLTMGCFNNLSKVNEEVYKLWIQILKTFPQTRLFLKAPQFQSDSIRHEWLTRCVRAGVDSERIVLEGPSPRKEYLQSYHRVDLALDPFPYTGGTVSIEALWMGVPVLTIKGHDMLSRSGANLLGNLNMTEWIASDQDAYLSMIDSCLKSPSALAQLRHQLRPRLLASSLCDAAGFSQHWQQLLWQLWQERHSDLPTMN